MTTRDIHCGKGAVGKGGEEIEQVYTPLTWRFAPRSGGRSRQFLRADHARPCLDGGPLCPSASVAHCSPTSQRELPSRPQCHLRERPTGSALARKHRPAGNTGFAMDQFLPGSLPGAGLISSHPGQEARLKVLLTDTWSCFCLFVLLGIETLSQEGLLSSPWGPRHSSPRGQPPTTRGDCRESPLLHLHFPSLLQSPHGRISKRTCSKDSP